MQKSKYDGDRKLPINEGAIASNVYICSDNCTKDGVHWGVSCCKEGIRSRCKNGIIVIDVVCKD